jgi:hypothetical protein
VTSIVTNPSVQAAASAPPVDAWEVFRSDVRRVTRGMEAAAGRTPVPVNCNTGTYTATRDNVDVFLK